MAIITVPEVKIFIGIDLTDDSEIDFLTQTVKAVDAAVKKFLDRDIEQNTYVDYYNGNNSKILILNEYPIANAAAVTSVYMDNQGGWGQIPGSFDPTTQLVLGQDYAVVLDQKNS